MNNETIIRSHAGRKVTVVEDFGPGFGLVTENTSVGIEKRIYTSLNAEEAHKLAQWILDNVEKPDPLPTEDGVYIPSTASPEGGPLLFVRYREVWNNPDLARYWAEKTGLTKLVKEEK